MAQVVLLDGYMHLMQQIIDLHNHTRLQINPGHTPYELFHREKEVLAAANVKCNNSCVCGRGKKYKKCYEKSRGESLHMIKLDVKSRQLFYKQLPAFYADFNKLLYRGIKGKSTGMYKVKVKNLAFGEIISVLYNILFQKVI